MSSGRLRALVDDGELVAAEARAEAEVARPTARRRSATACSTRSPNTWPMLSLMFLKLSRSRKNTPTRAPSRCVARASVVVQLHEELAPVRQPRQRVVLGEVLQLPRALLDLGLELPVVLARELLRRRQPLGHLVEGDRQRVEFLDAAARHDDARLALGEALGRPHQSPHRQDDAAHRADDRRRAAAAARSRSARRARCAAGAPARRPRSGPRRTGAAPSRSRGRTRTGRGPCGCCVASAAWLAAKASFVSLRCPSVRTSSSRSQTTRSRLARVCGEPFRAEHAPDALLVLGEQRRERLLAHDEWRARSPGRSRAGHPCRRGSAPISSSVRLASTR